MLVHLKDLLLLQTQYVRDVSNQVTFRSVQPVSLFGTAGLNRFDWKMHKIECQAISRLDNNLRNSATPEIRLMVKLYLRRKLQSDQIIPTTAIDNYKLVQKLVTHLSSISEEKLLLYTREAEIVKLMLQWPDINVSETTENFSKLSCNAHTITDSKMEPLGIGLCSPNSVLVFEGREAVIRAVQHAQKGDEVFISYIDTGSRTITRQDSLKQYFFTCTCSRCLTHDALEDETFAAFKCKNKKCSGFFVCKF
ncbi:histone-lysine N-methyltransferase ASHR1-like protein, partial [Corchorus capsularis]